MNGPCSRLEPAIWAIHPVRAAAGRCWRRRFARATHVAIRQRVPEGEPRSLTVTHGRPPGANQGQRAGQPVSRAEILRGPFRPSNHVRKTISLEKGHVIADIPAQVGVLADADGLGTLDDFQLTRDC